MSPLNWPLHLKQKKMGVVNEDCIGNFLQMSNESELFFIREVIFDDQKERPKI